MTDRYKGLVVRLEGNLRDDDAEASVMQAIRAIRFVADVQPIMADPGDWITAENVRSDMRKRVLAALDPPFFAQDGL